MPSFLSLSVVIQSETLWNQLPSMSKVSRFILLPLEASLTRMTEFHPKFIGLTGTYQQIKRIAKAYRLYFSAPPLALDDDAADYLVDHSIFFYLVGPDGKYVAHYGRQDPWETVTDKILEEVRKRAGPNSA
jgi:cytochrome oxidase Cu insertion factor (SCO1/SenC/PrrC family)